MERETIMKNEMNKIVEDGIILIDLEIEELEEAVAPGMLMGD